MKIEVSSRFKRYITDDLTSAFSAYQYRIENPMPQAGESLKTYIYEYQNNRIFHAKVDSIVSGVMVIIEKQLKDNSVNEYDKSFNNADDLIRHLKGNSEQEEN